VANATNRKDSGASPLPEAYRAVLQHAVHVLGENGTLETVVDLTRGTLARALGGLPLYPGSTAVIERGLPALRVRLAETPALDGARTTNEEKNR
jgi:hypothetical protein